MNVTVIAYTHPVNLPRIVRDDQLRGSPCAKVIEFAGRICYDSFGSGRNSEAYAKHILESGHGSVLEHASISFLIEGISRACSHELVRHRVGVAISQRSSRYCDESETPLVQHPAFEKLPPAVRETVVKQAQNTRYLYNTVYEELRAAGVDHKTARGAARFFLPQALATELVWTANLRALRHVIITRSDPAADPEIRLLARKLYDEAMKVCPEYLQDLAYIAALNRLPHEGH